MQQDQLIDGRYTNSYADQGRHEAAGRTHKSIPFHDAAATSPHGKDTNSYADQGRYGSCWSVRTKTFIFTMKSNLPQTFAIISCRKQAECCHRRWMLRLHVCPTIQPAIPAIYHTGEVFDLCRGQRAEQSQTAYNAGTDCKYFR